MPSSNRLRIQLTSPTPLSTFVAGIDIAGQTSMDAKAIAGFCADASARNLRPRTIEGYTRRLETLRAVAIMAGTTTLGLTKPGIRAWLFDVGTRWSQSTIASYLRVWKHFYKWACIEGLCTNSPMDGITMPKLDQKIPPVLKQAQMELLLESFDTTTFLGRRNFTMTVTLYDTAIRVGELIALTLDDIQPNRTLVISRSKSRRPRLVPVSADAYAVIESYIIGERRQIPGDALFCYGDGDPMTIPRVQALYRDLGKELGFRCYPHLFRHSSATAMANDGIPLRSLQKILGHSRLSTTEIYVHPDEATIRLHHDQHSPMKGLL